MAWELQMTEQAEQWFNGLSDKEAKRVTGAFEALEEGGPGLRRPTVGAIKGSRYHNMKELREGTFRALLAFDSDRRGTVLVGGNKRGDWNRWYRTHIPQADRLYDTHQRGTGRTTPWTTVKAGRKSAHRER